jgi:hypothetical protein
MRPVRVTLTAAGKSNPIILDTYRNPFSVGVNVAKTGDILYSVEYTYDDVFVNTYNPEAASSQWIAMSAFPVGTAVSKDSSLSTPVTAVRLNAASLTGSVTITVIQAGMPGG